MVRRYRYSEPIVVWSAGEVTDPYSGEVTYDWEAATSRTIDDCVIFPGTSADQAGVAGTITHSVWTILPPADVVILPTERVSFRGREPMNQEFDGELFDYLHPMSGWKPGGQVMVKGGQP